MMITIQSTRLCANRWIYHALHPYGRLNTNICHLHMTNYDSPFQIMGSLQTSSNLPKSASSNINVTFGTSVETIRNHQVNHTICLSYVYQMFIICLSLYWLMLTIIIYHLPLRYHSLPFMITYYHLLLFIINGNYHYHWYWYLSFYHWVTIGIYHLPWWPNVFF